MIKCSRLNRGPGDGRRHRLPVLVQAILMCVLAVNGQAIAAADVRSSTGIVVPERRVTLAAKIVGRIAAVNVEEGEAVRSGELLIAIDDAELAADLASARAALDQENVSLAYKAGLDRRYQTLLRKKSVSADQADEAAFNHAAAKARVDRARALIEKAEAILRESRIEAPFDGVIIARHAEIGQVTAPGEALLVLEDQNTLRFRTAVKEKDIPHVSVGQRIVVTIGALGDLELPAKIDRLIPSADTDTHEFVIEAVLPEHDHLHPGMFGRARFDGDPVLPSR